MKILKTISMFLLVVVFLMQSATVFAQDPVKACQNIYKKVVIDNKRVRVCEIEFAPGETATWHNHPDHLLYAVTAGKLEITEKGKPSSVADIAAGTTLFIPAVTHMGKNVGTTTFKAIVTELKPAMSKRRDGEHSPRGKK